MEITQTNLFNVIPTKCSLKQLKKRLIINKHWTDNNTENCESKTSTDYNTSSLFKLVHFPTRLKCQSNSAIWNSEHTQLGPVFIRPQRSKILELLFNNRMDSFFEKRVSESQCGFRVNRPTLQAVNESIKETTDPGRQQATDDGIIHWSKFDILNHSILFNKMEKYGIRCIVLQWIKSSL